MEGPASGAFINITARPEMLKSLFIALLVATVTLPSGCRKKFQNTVPLDQIESDSSNDYNFIFKKDIEEEKRQAGRFRKNEFRD